ncbi:MAG: putative bifunctional diguanylate cyclase/phosphodiesterase [Rhizobiaceae bacterium]
MTDTDSRKGSRSLLLRIKSAYWVALLAIAAMAAVSFATLGSMMSDQGRDTGIMMFANKQAEIVRDIVSTPSGEQSGADRARLRLLIGRFSENHATLKADLPSNSNELGVAVIGRSLDGTGSAFATDIEAQLQAKDATEITINTKVGGELLATYEALADYYAVRVAENANAIELWHRILFLATIGLIVLVIVFIFRPLSSAISKNASELVEARNSMAYVAAHDGLTGLNNRAFLLDHFQTMISGAKRRGERLAVLQIDLDGFKQINDTLGHAAGDHVLVETAERMRQSCRATDLCVRLGGDEFVMVLSAAGNTQDINMVAGRILERVNQPMSYEGATINAGASAGVAVYPVDADNADELLMHADLALYDAKKRGGGAYAFFSDDLRLELEHRKQLETDLHKAIETDAFDVHFQPQISLIDGRIAGVEALVRWSHPERGMVAPADFLPVAEKIGLMSTIGRKVIRKAISKASQWHRDGLEFGRLAVNISGAEVREPDFSEFLFESLAELGLPAEKLSLEIIESVILDDDKLGISTRLRKIRAAGVHLELDDFGTGYASLSHVNPNEIDRLKIDRRFVHNIDDDSDNTKIVKAITELARGLGIAIIAEGAETQEELNQLVEIGCEQVQGYSIAYPMPEDQAREWLEMHAKENQVVRLNAKRSA